MTEQEQKDALAKRDAEIATLKSASAAAEARATAAEKERDAVTLERDALASTVDGVAKALDAAGIVSQEETSTKNEKGETTVTVRLFQPHERIAKLTAERDTVRDQVTERDVDALVGVKITPTQKEKFLALAKKDREVFDGIVADLPELGLLGKAIPAAGPAESTASDGDAENLLDEPDGSETCGAGNDGEDEGVSSLI